MAGRSASPGQLVGTYIKAFYSLVADRQILDDVAEDLTTLKNRLEEDPRISYQFLNPLFSSQENENAMMPFIHDLAPVVQNLTSVLSRYRRLRFLPKIIDAYLHQYNDARGYISVEAHVAYPLSTQQHDRLIDKLEQITGKKILLTLVDRPDLLGGIQLQLQSILVDGTIRAQLDRLRAQLKGDA